MRRRGELRVAVLSLALLGCLACDSTRLASASSRHVKLHWDKGEQHLCGGTLAYIDASLEIVAETYAVDLAASPAIEMYWTLDPNLPHSVCGKPVGGCAVMLPNGVSYLFSPDPIDPHELTHAVRLASGNRRLPSFFLEGVAVRWEHGFSDSSVGKDTYVGNLDSTQLRDFFSDRQINTSTYSDAGFFWSWLEAEYSAEKMAHFTAELDPRASVAEIERAFEHSFGISLDHAAEISQGQPMWMFDIHACSMTELPRLTWTGAPMTLFDGPRDCTASDVVNSETNAIRSVRLNLPDPPNNYEITVTEPGRSNVRFDRCVGSARPFETSQIYGAPSVDAPVQLGGEYVVTAIAPIGDDGWVAFPEVRLVRP